MVTELLLEVVMSFVTRYHLQPAGHVPFEGSVNWALKLLKATMVSPNLTISCSGVIGVALELTIGTRPKSVSALLFSILEE